jgi:hypothetical protein
MILATPAAADRFILNGSSGQRYSLFQFSDDGVANPPSPIVDVYNSGGAQHVAWPSGFVLTSGATRIYASRNISGRWSDIAYWSSADGLTYTLGGVALSSAAGEPHGIGPGQVYYDKTEPAPWKMVFLVRDGVTGTQMHLADSLDGIAWTRRGLVFQTTEVWESGGVSPSWMMRSHAGEIVLFYQAYRSANTGPAAVARAASWGAMFGAKRIIMEPTEKSYQVTNAQRLTTTATVPGAVDIGVPHVMRQNDGMGLEVIVPIRQNGSTVWFDRPLLASYTVNSTLAHVGRKKVDPSFLRQHEDGSWSGIFTGYGQFPGVTSEYTFFVWSPNLETPFVAVAGNGVPFSPWHVGGFASMENPALISPID